MKITERHTEGIERNHAVFKTMEYGGGGEKKKKKILSIRKMKYFQRLANLEERCCG